MSALPGYIDSVDGVRGLLEPSGLLDFLTVRAGREGYIALLKALAERWWDTTNTFHFPCGEMTVTPTDLTMISGLHFGTCPFVFYDDWRDLPSGHVFRLLGVEPPRHQIYVQRSWIRSCLDPLAGTGALLADAEQTARLVLLMVMGCSFLHTRRDSMNLNILRSLENLSIIGEYDWGGAALGTMYREIGDLSRGAFNSLGGMSFVWEVCI